MQGTKLVIVSKKWKRATFLDRTTKAEKAVADPHSNTQQDTGEQAKLLCP